MISNNRNIPTIVIYNIAETFYDFLQRASDERAREHLLLSEQVRGDRALTWGGDPKLVFVSFPIPHADSFCRQYNYPQTQYFCPKRPSEFLCLDILREPGLLKEIVNYAEENRELQVIPYAATPQLYQLVEALGRDWNLVVHLPECPLPENMWLRDYIDTKSGFRLLVSRWLEQSERLLPGGIICDTLDFASKVISWYGAGNCTCLVKADTGENGIGNQMIQPGQFASEAEILASLKSNPFFADEPVTVEEFIAAPDGISPSLELYIPPLNTALPQITYLSTQLFLAPGDFCGVLLDRDLENQPWYVDLKNSGFTIASRLQAMGYVGYMDIDCVVDKNNHLHLLEANARRTGGTHVHEFAYHFWGEDYLSKVTLLSDDAMPAGEIKSCEELFRVLDGLLYPISGEERGVVVMVTSSLTRIRDFGCIFVGSCPEEVFCLKWQVKQRVAEYQPEC